ncbi:MAG: PAS domain S-box protein [Anaeromyxobacter sp.]|nr:PAS domain S-box protein [Anaeromyxobacter sp.]
MSRPDPGTADRAPAPAPTPRLDADHLREAQRIGHMGSWELDLVRGELRWSDELFTLFELDPSRFGASYQAFLALVHPEDRDRVDRAYRTSVADRAPYDTIHRLLMPDGRVKHVQERGQTWYDPDGRPLRSIGTAHDVSSIVEMEQQLLMQREALAHSPAAVAFAGLDGVLTFVNDRFLDMWGFDGVGEVVGRSAVEFWARPEEAAVVLQHVAQGERANAELLARRRDGRTFPALVLASGVRSPSGQVVAVLGQFLDLSEQRRLEAQVRQSQKLEAVGRLAGGVAHDFNNLLTVINGNCEFLLAERTLAGPVREEVELIRAAGASAAGLTRQLLAFSRKQVLQPATLDLNELVVRTERMLRRVIGEDVDLRCLLSPEPWLVRVDPSQLEQVILNLAVNARDALPGGGRITIETGQATLDEAYTRRHADVQPGDYMLLTVSDDGVGMDPETLSRVFEPFFSTKGPQGTGLGLATVYGIVRQSGGHVAAYSEPGRGTTFKVYLPRAPAAGAAPAPADGGPPPAPTHDETVLVVEDAEGVRSLVARTLGAQGYRVLQARSAEEALAAAAGHAGRIHLLLSDVVMPGLGGRELAAELARQRPGLAVLFMSGYPANAIAHRGALEPGVNFIAKPFSLDALERKVAEVLARARGP